ncbi:putative LysR family regulatory protein [Xylaria digitata]|nr:putative LysR family regulatory protein [Xylaria digitata]
MAGNSSTLKPPPIVPADYVIPFRFTDNFFRASLDFTIRFDDVLDTDKLYEALGKLYRRERWSKLGARLRLNKDGKLEYHVPIEFSEKRPAFLFTTNKHEIPIAQHPHLSQLPKSNSERAELFLPSSQSFRPYTRGRGAPQTFEDWLYSHAPQLTIHVINFTDTTIITVTVLHSFADFMGLVGVLRAWTQVLHDEEEQIPPFIAFDHYENDPIDTLANGASPSQYVHANRVVTGWSFFKFTLRNMLQVFWYPKVESRFVSIRERVELVEGKTTPFLSEGDVISAFWARVITRALNTSPERTVTLVNNFDSRGVLAEMNRIPAANAILLGNAAYPATALMGAGELTSTTLLGLLAHQIRNAITTHRTQLQLQAQAALIQETIKKHSHPPIYGDSGMLLLPSTNWQRGKLFQLDFSPAIIARKQPENENPYKGKPSFVTSTSVETRTSMRNATVLVGKDQTGIWWLITRLRLQAWKSIEKQLNALDVT